MTRADTLVVRLNDEPPRVVTNSRQIKVILFLLNHLDWFKEDYWSLLIDIGGDDKVKFKHTENITIN